MRYGGSHAKRIVIPCGWMPLILLALYGSANAERLLPNGGFEKGSSSPDGWKLEAAAHWEAADGGGKLIRISQGKGGRVLVSEPIPILSNTDYRVEAWLRVPDGKARIGFDLLSRDGKVLASYASMEVYGEKKSVYRAIESKLEPPEANRPTAATAVVWVEAEGNADVDDIFLAPVSPLFFKNAEMEEQLDRKGRVPFWTEEKDGWQGTAYQASGSGGTQTLDKEIKFAGAQALKLTSSKEWHASGSINYPIWEWSDRWQGRAWARCEAGAKARLIAVWSEDDLAKVVRADAGPEFAAAEWTEIFTSAMEPPKGATQVRLVLLASGGSVWFDEARLITLPAVKPLVKVLVNQVGYDLGKPKSAVIATDYCAAGPARIEILDKKNQKVGEVQAECAGRMRGENDADWGWYFWRADFSSIDKEGEFKLKASVGEGVGESYPFTIGRDLLFSRCAPMDVDFFFVQRCGFEVPGWHAACHLDDAKMPDGTRRELTGGWHSAGDYNKLPWEYGDGAATYALARAARTAPGFFAKFDRDYDGIPDAAGEALWGAQFLSKIQIIETGNLLGNIEQGPNKQAFFQWLPPDRHTDNIPGTPDDPIVAAPEGNTPLALAGWAVAAGLAPQELQRDYLARAEKMMEFYRQKAGSESNPHVILSAIEFYRAEQKPEILEYARKGVEALLQANDPGGPIKGGYGDSGDVPCAALAAFALAAPSEPLSARIKERLAKHLEFMIAEPRNPFGISKQKSGEGGFYFEPSSVYGQNFMFSSRAWGALSIYRVTGDRRALGYAMDHLDWLLGKNPYGLCMMEGLGSFNPPRYHHRYDSIPGRERGAVPGAIPNGFVRDVGGYDRPGFDLSRTGRPHPSYRTCEPWLVHNILNLLAVTTLHEAEE